METEKKKIYCKDCKHFNGVVDCDHPKNHYIEDTPFGPKQERLRSCWQKNGDNNCKDFEPKPKHGIIELLFGRFFTDGN